MFRLEQNMLERYESLFRGFQASEEVLKSRDPNCYINWLGIETDARMFPHGRQLQGRVIADLPLGSLGDNVYGGASEYGALLMAVEGASRRGGGILTVVELGAGWGPWISAAGLAGRKLGMKSINLVGVEAEPDRFAQMGEHMTRNGLITNNSDMTIRLIQGAAWKENTTLKFGSNTAADHGGAATADNECKDYRGAEVQFMNVPAYDLPTICQGLGIIDYMHWDIQGAEFEVAEGGVDYMNEHVRSVFIGTHSPLIDGQLLDMFYKNQWDVVSFDPCPITYNRNKASLRAMAIRDGEIFATNPRIA
jgi:FkbM family methyltransferase